MRPLHASDSARMNRMNATKDAATMTVDNKIRIFIATPALVVATTVLFKENSYEVKYILVILSPIFVGPYCTVART
jgi:hypothetical protein